VTPREPLDGTSLGFSFLLICSLRIICHLATMNAARNEFPVSQAEKKLLLRIRNLSRGVHTLLLRKGHGKLFLTVQGSAKEENLSRKTQ